MYNILIVKYGEIGVKGKNRYIFENKLIKNVKNILKPIGKFNVYKEYGRIYVDLDGYDYEEVVEEAEETLVHVARDRVGDEGVRHERERDGEHGDDRRVERGARVVHFGRGGREIAPLPARRQRECARLRRRLQCGDHG